ncbi:MAG TPA: carboxypeptidase-like regulatory domain-containing protein, partial [Acidobacteriaceae bacterium]|nr:carboxypeptidase-like regulatory domain-containing protein [Acidobacteriaceae bacterium]
MRLTRLLLGFGVMLAAPCILFAQAGATGTILGTVTDSSGAVVPNAKITITNTATKVISQTSSNSVGDYNVPALNP